MKMYTFNWQCDEAWGSFEMEISEEEVELIKQAHRDAFTYLEEVSELDDLHDRAMEQIPFYEPYEDQDIRVYYPEEIVDEADEEDDEE